MKIVRLVPVLFAISLLAVSFAQPASATPISDLEDCSDWGRSMSLPDRSMIVPMRCTVGGSPEPFYVKLRSNGSIDTDWASGGLRSWTGDHPWIAAVRPDGSLVVATRDSITGLDERGLADRTFADNGVISSVEHLLGGPIRETAIGPGGSLTVMTSDPTVLARFDRSGSLVPEFGSDGIVVPPSPVDPDEKYGPMAVDGSGRVLLGAGTTLLRLTNDGEPDATFGVGGFAVGDSTIEESRPIRISTEASGLIRFMTGPLVPSYTMCLSVYQFTFEDSGTLLDGQSGEIGCGGRDYVSIGGNRVAYSKDFERAFGNEFVVRAFGLNGLGTGTTSAWSRRVAASPGPNSAGFLEYLPVPDQILSVGYAAAYECHPGDVCGDESSLLVTRLDAKTGAVDKTFGDQGFVTIPGNDCRAVEVGDPEDRTPWRRCALPAPEFAVNAVVKGRKNPAAVIRLNLAEEVQGDLNGTTLKMRFKLPGYLRPRGPGAVWNHRRLSSPPGYLRFSARNRALDLLYKVPEVGPYDDQLPSPLSFKVTIDRGAFKPIRPRAKVATSTRFEFSATPEGTDATWFDPILITGSLGFRPQRAR